MKYYYYLAILQLLLAVSIILFPGLWVSLLCLLDYHTSWVLFESSWYEAYHNYLISTLPDREEIPLQEISSNDATPEIIKKLTKDFTEPLVIRGLLINSTAVRKWSDDQWWLDNYKDEEVLCGTLEHVVEDNCTIGSFFKNRENGTPFYISGASQIFKKRPEMHEMVDNEQLRHLTEKNGLKRINTQIFMGFSQMGSDIHSAQGINIFRMIVGHKKWWFIPPNQTPYLKPSINSNAFSAHTGTKVGKNGELPSLWMNKIIRYTIILNPGDVLINPPWYWHGVINEDANKNDDSKDDLIIGTPTRYKGNIHQKAMIKNNFIFSINFMLIMLSRYGLDLFKPDFTFNMEAAIRDNRRSREGKETQVTYLNGTDMVLDASSSSSRITRDSDSTSRTFSK